MYATLRVPGENKVIMTVEPKNKSWYDMCIEDEEKEEQEKEEQEKEKQEKEEQEKEEQEKEEQEKEEKEKEEKQEEEQKQKDILETRKALLTEGKYELEEGEILE